MVVTPTINGFILNAVDFDELSVEADNIQNGLSCIQAAIAERITGAFPPLPTPCNEIVIQPGEFTVMVNV